MDDYQKTTDSLRICAHELGCEGCAYRHDPPGNGCDWKQMLDDTAEAFDRLRVAYEGKKTEADEYLNQLLRVGKENDALKKQIPRIGYWKSVPHKAARVCSVCKKDEPYKFADDDANVFDFCPHCGSIMKGKPW